MTILNNIESRSKSEKFVISRNLEYLNKAIKSNLIFTIDEYIVSIYNTFFSDRRSFPGDQLILKELIKLSLKIGNDRNALIIEEELNQIGKIKNIPINSKLTYPLKTIMPEDIRTKIRGLKRESGSYEIGSEFKNNTRIFDYDKYIDNFDDRFIWSLNLYNNIKNSKSRSVLDIGTGMGYIPFIFKHNDYEVSSFDMEGCSEIFDKSCKILNVDKKNYTIKKYTKIINFNKKFDLINASLISFNEHREQTFWKRKEWVYFLNDIYQNHLNDGGVLYLGFNSEIDNNSYLFLGDKDLHLLFDPYIKNSATKTAVLNKNDIKNILNINNID